jgi:serine/threonine protein kinase
MTTCKIVEIINFNKPLFGFYKKKCLKDSKSGDIKGIPYLYYNYNKDVKVVVKIIPVDLNKIDDNSMIEILYLELFNKDLLNTKIIPGIPKMFCYYTNIDNTRECITKVSMKKHCNFSNILFCEYISLGDIDKWCCNNLVDEDTWKNVIIQIALTLDVLQKKYLFIHNDMHPGNILVQKLDKDTPLLINNVLVKNKGVLVKLWDFEFSNLYNENYPEYSNPIKFDIGFNKAYDLHTFLKGLLEITDLPTKLVNFIEELYPLELLYEYPFCNKTVNICTDNRFISNGFLTRYATLKYRNILITPEKLLEHEYLCVNFA